MSRLLTEQIVYQLFQHIFRLFSTLFIRYGCPLPADHLFIFFCLHANLLITVSNQEYKLIFSFPFLIPIKHLYLTLRIKGFHQRIHIIFKIFSVKSNFNIIKQRDYTSFHILWLSLHCVPGTLSSHPETFPEGNAHSPASFLHRK